MQTQPLRRAMQTHSTDVDLCQLHVDGLLQQQLQQLQTNHLWLRQQLTLLQSRVLSRRLQQLERLLLGRAALESKLRQLQLKYNRRWSL
ncbi:uncharacterized protein LOC108602710 [Drosophila busckii]|uniref:uncharacterized protein LOC108602710 n=1 Tax=Drosophila busckii TaxID=30019 RepID=UPI00083ED2E5|nr:uncharacterized protein LOC108602710 [Drosophila busckii]